MRLCVDLEERKKERAPEFLSNFGDTLVMEGTDCRLSLGYVGYPQPEVTWLFNGHVISQSDIYDMAVSGDEARLLIRRAVAPLTGDYSCRLHNKFGTTEVVARVTVGDRPKLIGQLDHLDVTVGDAATFECKYKGFPVPDVFWYHNKLPLTVSSYFTFMFYYDVAFLSRGHQSGAGASQNDHRTLLQRWVQWCSCRISDS